MRNEVGGETANDVGEWQMKRKEKGKRIRRRKVTEVGGEIQKWEVEKRS